MKFREIDEKSILRIIPLDKNIIDLANKALKNEIFLLKTLNPIKFDKEINWNYNEGLNKTSYLLYLHSLNCIGHLTSAYELTKDIKYIEKAKEIMNSWILYDKKGNLNNMVWYDHTVSNRSRNILHFYLIAKDIINLDTQVYENLINKHIDFLYDDKNYKLNNHGIMMDRALLCCASVIDERYVETFKQKALGRLKENFYQSFSYKGTHLENSIFYHNYVKKMYEEIEVFLNKIGLSLGENLLIKLKRTNNYFNYATKPDGTLPLIGDGDKIKSNYENKLYEDFYDYEAGISYLQYKNKENPIDSIWISFICGYSSKTHKQRDDLSFTLYYGGKDIFVDSGYFGYGNTPERKYFISQKSHNTFFINENYKLVEPEESFEKIKTTDFISNKHYSLVKGQNISYNNTQLYRAIILFKPDIIFIYDKGISNSEKEYTQLFNLSPEVKVTKVDKKTCLLDDNIEIIQINNELISTIHKTNLQDITAVISEKAETLTDTTQVSFKKKSQNINILTLISLDNSKEKIKNLKFDKENEILYLSINDIDYSICL